VEIKVGRHVLPNTQMCEWQPAMLAAATVYPVTVRITRGVPFKVSVRCPADDAGKEDKHNKKKYVHAVVGDVCVCVCVLFAFCVLHMLTLCRSSMCSPTRMHNHTRYVRAFKHQHYHVTLYCDPADTCPPVKLTSHQVPSQI
jgi:hypothetical protein